MTDASTPPTDTDASGESPPETPPRRLPSHPLLASLAEPFADVEFTEFAPRHGPVQHIAHVPAGSYHDFVAAARKAGFDAFRDLCAVDYLRRRPRFEVVVNLLSQEAPLRLRIRVGVDGPDPTVATISDVFPGANFYEREAYDLFGIEFQGHPDLTRILLPDDWEGYPLRKDVSVGSVPVQFKGAHKAS